MCACVIAFFICIELFFHSIFNYHNFNGFPSKISIIHFGVRENISIPFEWQRDWLNRLKGSCDFQITVFTYVSVVQWSSCTFFHIACVCQCVSVFVCLWMFTFQWIFVERRVFYLSFSFYSSSNIKVFRILWCDRAMKIGKWNIQCAYLKVFFTFSLSLSSSTVLLFVWISFVFV